MKIEKDQFGSYYYDEMNTRRYLLNCMGCKKPILPTEESCKRVVSRIGKCYYHKQCIGDFS